MEWNGPNLRLCVLVAASMGGAPTASAQVGCAVQWIGMPNDRGDADLAVGRSHVLVADHDHYRLFNKCGTNLAFVDPAAPITLSNGIPHGGIESGIESFYYNAIGDYDNYAQQTGSDLFADERVIHDPITNRFIAMVTQPTDHGVFIGVSNVHDGASWPEPKIRALLMEVPCPDSDTIGVLHRGSISTSNDPANAEDSLLCGSSERFSSHNAKRASAPTSALHCGWLESSVCRGC